MKSPILEAKARDIHALPCEESQSSEIALAGVVVMRHLHHRPRIQLHNPKTLNLDKLCGPILACAGVSVPPLSLNLKTIASPGYLSRPGV